MSAPVPVHVPARALLVEVLAPARGVESRWEIVWEGSQGTASSGQRYGLAAARALAAECGARDIEERPR